MTRQRKPYNPNTAYGRRKLREQWFQNLEGNNQNTSTSQNSNDGCSQALGWLLVILLGLLVAWAKKAVK